MSTRSIIAVEMCLRFDPRVHAFLRGLVAQDMPALGFQQKWHLYGQICQCLIDSRGLWASGCWDFFDQDMRARGDFNMWVQGMTTAEGARHQPSSGADPYRAEPTFMTFTMACLMVRGTPSERLIASLCQVSEAYLWHAATFVRVLALMRHLNFASVEGSTLYVLPNDPAYALTATDMKHPKFHYLRPIV